MWSKIQIKAFGLLFLLLSTTTTTALFAQRWLNAYGNAGLDKISKIAADLQDNIYAGGVFSNTITIEGQSYPSIGGEDVLINKLDGLGNLKWSRSFGSADDDEVGGLVVLEDLFMVGTFWDQMILDKDTLIANGINIYLTKWDTAGTVLWSKVIEGTGFQSVERMVSDEDTHLYFTGMFSDTLFIDNVPYVANAFRDIFLCKIDTAGQVIWFRHAGTSGTVTGETLDYHDGKIALAGQLNGTVTFGNNTLQANTNDDDLHLSVWDTTGNVLWSHKIGGINEDLVEAVTFDDWGNIYMTGNFVNVLNFGNGNQITTTLFDNDIFLAKYNNIGQIVWAKRLGGTHNDFGVGLATQNNKLLLTGYFRDNTTLDNFSYNTTSFDFEGFIAELDTMGNVLEVEIMTGAGACFPIDVLYGQDGAPIYAANFEMDLKVIQEQVTAQGSFDMAIGSMDFPINTHSVLPTTIFDVFPNPASTQVTIAFEDTRKRMIQVFDITGQRIQSPLTVTNQTITLDVGKWGVGIYVLKVEENGRIYNKKLVVF